MFFLCSLFVRITSHFCSSLVARNSIFAQASRRQICERKKSDAIVEEFGRTLASTPIVSVKSALHTALRPVDVATSNLKKPTNSTVQWSRTTVMSPTIKTNRPTESATKEVKRTHIAVSRSPHLSTAQHHD